MKTHDLTRALFAMVASAAAVACAGDFGQLRSQAQMRIAITGGDIGTDDKRLPLTLTTGTFFDAHVEAHAPDGSLDTTFNDWVRISSKPGDILPLQPSSTGASAQIDGRNVLLKDGKADIRVGVIGAYGDSRLWAEDMGYVPADPTRKPPPQCSDGVDNNGDGTIDFPNDPGCAFPNDDTEALGTYVAGTSGNIFFTYPRVADVRGVSQGGGATSFPHDQVQIDMGFRPSQNRFQFSVVVTRIASDGFYVTDIDDPRGYSSIYMFNFSAPSNLRVCDRLTSLNGTASDFYGFTEMGYPTWQVEEWSSAVRPCLVPEPAVLGPADITSTPTLLYRESSLVRIQTGKVANGDYVVRIGAHFGKDKPSAPDYKPTDDASNCDINGDGKIDYYTDPEKTCAANCTADLDCSEYSAFAAQSEFRVVVHDNTPGAAPADGTIQANASTAAQIDPVALKGKTLGAFSGTLRYFSGGSQFTIEARCQDDIVLDPNTKPLPSDKACVQERTAIDLNAGSN